ncbi:MAG: response regulator transcription factor [Bacteroidales bacterium]|nr:response regulator transcription factor [Bacteroidales bacterium]
MKIIVIDDEVVIRNSIANMLTLYCDDVEIIDTCGSVDSGIVSILKNKPDLVLLDIRIEGGTGFDIIKALGDKMPRLIFITAHEDYAIKAFKYNAIDYLVKPIDPDELEQAINKVSKIISKEDNYSILSNLLQEVKNNKTPEKIVLKTQESIHIVKISDIIYCMSDGSYTNIITKDKKIIVSTLIKEYTELLKEHMFIRVHQSYLINMNKVISYNKEGYVILEGNISVPVAGRRKEYFLSELELAFNK